MPTSSQLRKFANERVRPMMDQGEAAYRTAKQFVAEYDSTGINAMLGANTDVIEDGSAEDGRKSLTVAEIKRVYQSCQAMVAWYEGTTILNKTIIDAMRAGSVNGRAAF